MNKKQLITDFGGTEAEMARQLGMSSQRVNLWGETLNKQQIDGVLAALVRKAKVQPSCVPLSVWKSIHAE
jgi:hypothetical protein